MKLKGVEQMTIREAREATGRSMAKITRMFNIPYVTWQAWERNERTPPDYIMNFLIEELELVRIGQFSDEVSQLSLKELRLQYGLNRKDVSSMLNIPLITINNYESEKRIPPDYVIFLIKRGLERKCKELYG